MYPSTANNLDVKLFKQKPTAKVLTQYFKNEFAAARLSPDKTLNLIAQLFEQYQNSSNSDLRINLKKLFRSCLKTVNLYGNVVHKQKYCEVAIKFALETIGTVINNKTSTAEQARELEKYTYFTTGMGTDAQKAEFAAQYRESIRLAEANGVDGTTLQDLKNLLDIIYRSCPHWERSSRIIPLEPGM